MIEVKNLEKKYGNHTAVNDISFQIEPGKIYGLLGPNGAGKTTTMNIITGYLGASSGSVLIDEHDISKEPEKAKKLVGYLPEIPPLYLDMTVTEYLYFVGELKGIPSKDLKERVSEVIENCFISDVSGRIIGNLSKGYRQRVGIAQAILGYPKYIILDEPTVGLDPKQILQIRDLVRELSKKHTIIISSHILAEIREMCDYIIIISKGNLVASDSLSNLENKYCKQGGIKIVTDVNKDEITRVLSNVKDIKEIVFEESDEANTTACMVIPNEDKDIRREVFRAFADNKIDLLSMTDKKTTLEEVFIQLTTA